MSTGLKLEWRVWAQSLALLARSPLYILVLAAIAGLWGWAGYAWLGLPESSGLVLLLALLWILALAALLIAALAGTVASVYAAASEPRGHLSLRRVLSFARFGITALFVLAALVGIYLLAALFGWINGLALSVASFLTFHSQQAVSYKLIGEILWVAEALIWVMATGALMKWMILVSSPRPPAAASVSTRVAQSYWMTLATGILAAGVFGGSAWLLATWRPLVTPGAWDYAQLLVRNILALLLLTLGWLFWALSLARITVARPKEPEASPPPS
jgi:hypothetical protein